MREISPVIVVYKRNLLFASFGLNSGEWKMPDYYVALVKEYLELQDFIVRTETKYKIRKKDKRGIERTSWGDIDILAMKAKDNNVFEAIIGEVKAEYKTEKEIEEINEDKFENLYVKQKLEELLGTTNYKKYLFCWSWHPMRREFAEKLGITPVSFDEIITYMLKKVEEHKGWFYLMDYPNLMLLQFLQTRGYLRKE